MKRLIKAAQPFTLALLTAFAVGLSSCASVPPPCVTGDAGIKTVSGHNSFRFRKDWNEFRADLSDFRQVAIRQDAQELNSVASSLRRSMAAVKSYSPASVGKACEAFTNAKVKLNAAVLQLDQFATSTDWPAARKLASEVTDRTDKLREALPSSWFVRHRHGKRFH